MHLLPVRALGRPWPVTRRRGIAVCIIGPISEPTTATSVHLALPVLGLDGCPPLRLKHLRPTLDCEGIVAKYQAGRVLLAADIEARTHTADWFRLVTLVIQQSAVSQSTESSPMQRNMAGLQGTVP